MELYEKTFHWILPRPTDRWKRNQINYLSVAHQIANIIFVIDCWLNYSLINKSHANCQYKQWGTRRICSIHGTYRGIIWVLQVSLYFMIIYISFVCRWQIYLRSRWTGNIILSFFSIISVRVFTFYLARRNSYYFQKYVPMN